MTLMDKLSCLCGRGVFFALVSLWLAHAPTAAAQVFTLEEPPFETLKKSANFELRSYRSMVIAQVTVQGDVIAAGKEGSRLVKDYIFRQGVNQPTAAGKQADEKISMTVPVTME